MIIRMVDALNVQLPRDELPPPLVTDTRGHNETDSNTLYARRSYPLAGLVLWPFDSTYATSNNRSSFTREFSPFPRRTNSEDLQLLHCFWELLSSVGGHYFCVLTPDGFLE